MKRISITLLIILTTLLEINAQDLKYEEYKGKLNDSTPITLYLRASENECTADLVYQGMYKYEGVKNWLQLKITQNDQNQFILVGYRFTGVLMLTKTKEGFTGLWISSDTKKQLKVELEKSEITADEIETYEDIYEEVNYSNNDC